MSKAKTTKEVQLPIEALITEYDSLRGQKKTIEDRMKYLSDLIKAHAEKTGVKDDKGSFYAENDSYVYGKQCKKSVSFDKDKAIAYFKDKGYDECVDTVEVINEDAVECHVNNGDISLEDLEAITVTKVTYAIDIKKKEDMPVVEQTEVPLAASKKTRLVPKGGKK